MVVVVQVNMFTVLFLDWVRGDEYHALIIPIEQNRCKLNAKLRK